LETNIVFRLSSTRRKRAVPEDWATEEKIQGFQQEIVEAPTTKDAQAISVDSTGDLVIVGGAEGRAFSYSLANSSVLQEYEVGDSVVTDVAWVGSKAAIASSSGAVKVYDKSTEIASFSQHAGKVTAIAVHPSGEIIGSVGVDKSIVFYDIVGEKVATQIFTNAGMFKKISPLVC
jgi:pre-mRNA-processing factor 19